MALGDVMEWRLKGEDNRYLEGEDELVVCSVVSVGSAGRFSPSHWVANCISTYMFL